MHGRSLATETFGLPFSYMGPGTRLDIRLNSDGTPKNDSLPINNADYESYKHDIAYDNAKKAYNQNPTQQNKKIQMSKIHRADDIFINKMENPSQIHVVQNFYDTI